MSNKGKHAGKQRTWFRLDNAAKIFPGQNSSKWSNIFRLSVTLDKKIDPGLLEQALEQTIVRFPCFDVRMRRGFFGIIWKRTSTQRRRYCRIFKIHAIVSNGMKTGVFFSGYIITRTGFHSIFSMFFATRMARPVL